ncbi:Factor of DNA methylation 1 [Linum grandiflorum]
MSMAASPPKVPGDAGVEMEELYNQEEDLLRKANLVISHLVPGDAGVEMEEIHNQEEDLLSKANQVISHLNLELDTKANELAELRNEYADNKEFCNRIITQLVKILQSRDATILELEQKNEHNSAVARCLKSENDQMQDYYLREIKDLKVQLECSMEWQEQLEQQVEEKVEQQLAKEEEISRSLLEEMEKLKESMQAENLEYIRNSSDKFEALKEELEEKEEALQFAEDLNCTLMVKEVAANQELQNARKESINGLLEVMTDDPHWSTIRIKRMGEINGQVFREACLGKFSNEEVDAASAKLCSLWEQHLADPHWHPFKHICIGDQPPQEVIDENDEKLKELRNEYGKVVHDAVTKALAELNEYNPSGRYPVYEMWNLKEGRKANMKEIVQHLINQLKIRKRKRR